MALTTAERNRRKRERKKKEKEEKKKEEEEKQDAGSKETKIDDDVEIEYIAELPPLPPDDENFAAVRRFQERVAAAVVVTDDERNHKGYMDDDYNDRKRNRGDEDEDEDEEGGEHNMSKRKLRDMLRPSVAELKRKVQRPDLVEAHDITSPDPEFLIALKAAPGTVPVPRHWGRKRKYLQGKRGFEKPPFKLPDYIVKTGITDVRDTAAEEEAALSAKQKNRRRVAPKMGAIDVDYKTLHDAFFKYQTKPTHLTEFGDLYYEGKEMEVQTNIKPGGPLSRRLREALGMVSETSPPPWLINMQRYGPPPSYPSLKIPGLNAPLPSPDCQYGYHPGGWGKPPVDAYGRPLYGGNPFDPPGSSSANDPYDLQGTTLVTSDGKTIEKSAWGALPTGYAEKEEESEEEEEEEEDSEMEESEAEEGEAEEEEEAADGVESVLPPPLDVPSAGAVTLRKQAGDETPLVSVPVKQLYQVIEQKKAASDGAVFASEVAYVVPGAVAAAVVAPDGAESVLSKAVPNKDATKRKRNENEDDDLGKNFKF